jgi:hypothetical protein
MAAAIATTTAGAGADSAAAYALNGCTWDDPPAVMLFQYETNVENSAYQPIIEDAMKAWESALPGHIMFQQAHESVKEVQFKVAFKREGPPPNEPAPTGTEGGEFISNGAHWYNGHCKNGARLVLNLNRTDRFITRDPTIVRMIVLHELGHLLGLGHTALHTPATSVHPQSDCNIMFESFSPFEIGGECQGQGGILKLDDIDGGMAAYKHYPPDPGLGNPFRYIPDHECGGLQC